MVGIPEMVSTPPVQLRLKPGGNPVFVKPPFNVYDSVVPVAPTLKYVMDCIPVFTQTV